MQGLGLRVQVFFASHLARTRVQGLGFRDTESPTVKGLLDFLELRLQRPRKTWESIRARAGLQRGGFGVWDFRVSTLTARALQAISGGGVLASFGFRFLVWGLDVVFRL